MTTYSTQGERRGQPELDLCHLPACPGQFRPSMRTERGCGGNSPGGGTQELWPGAGWGLGVWRLPIWGPVLWRKAWCPRVSRAWQPIIQFIFIQ